MGIAACVSGDGGFGRGWGAVLHEFAGAAVSAFFSPRGGGVGGGLCGGGVCGLSRCEAFGGTDAVDRGVFAEFDLYRAGSDAGAEWTASGWGAVQAAGSFVFR